jgi:micrococcal nuclease
VPIVVGQWCENPRGASVACVVDGDTLDLDGCGDDGQRVRLLGIDAPEVAHGDQETECGGDAATSYLSDLLLGENITVEHDLTCTDMYGRELAYLVLDGDADDPLAEELADLDGLGMAEDGSYEVLVNELLLRAGIVRLYTHDDPADLRYGNRLIAAEIAAAQDNLGIWATCEE